MNLVARALAGHLVFVGFLLGALAAAGWPPAALAETAWWWPLWVSQLGLLTGSLAWAALAHADDAPEDTVAEGRRIDLQETRAIVVEQLRHLEVERDKLTAEDYVAERAALVEVGAAASRALDEAGEPPASAPEGSAGSAADPIAALAAELAPLRQADPATFDAAIARMGVKPTPRGLPDLWRGVVFTLATVLVLGVVGWNVSGTARDRQAGMPMTGGDQVMASNEPAPRRSAAPPGDGSDPLALLRQRAEDHPDDLQAWNQLTEMALARQDMQLALRANQRAVELDPDNPDTRTFSAVLAAFIGRVDEALDSLAAILDEHEDHLRALVYRGLLTMERDPAVAVDALERALAQDDNPMLRRALADARAAAGGAPAQAPEQEILASGTLEIDGEIPDDATLFLSLRDPSGGPPLAAQRQTGPAPSTFSLTTRDRIQMGGGDRPIPDKLTLIARLDTDGDPMTRPPSDPSAKVEIDAGAQEVRLVLRAGP